MRFKQNVIKHDKSREIMSPEGTTFMQYVSDNSDQQLATLDGKKTHHGLGSLAIANGNFTTENLPSHRIPRDKKEKWSNVEGNNGIEIHEYFEPDTPALSKTIFKPIQVYNAILQVIFFSVKTRK